MTTTHAIFTILIADDHPVTSMGLMHLLNAQQTYKVVGLAADGEQAWQLFQEWTPDVLLLDIAMPQKSGLEVARLILEHSPSTFVIFFTNHLSQAQWTEIQLLPIKGVLLKESTSAEIVKALETILEGKIYLSHSIAQRFEHLSANASFKTTDKLQRLTKTEREILGNIAQGLTSKEISEKMCRSVHTIEKHRSNICKKLEVTGVNGLVYFLMGHEV
ncbi:MAG: response regulator [Thermonemataceae bacterium]